MGWKKLYQPTNEEIRALRHEYQGKARFLVDESAGKELANFLEGAGFNARYVDDLGLGGRSDEDVFAAAWREKRVLVTHDADFLDDKRFPPHRNPGVIVIRPGSDGRNTRGLVACLVKALQIAGKRSKWFRGKRLDFSSEEEFSIKSPGSRARYRWPANGEAMEWEE